MGRGGGWGRCEMARGEAQHKASREGAETHSKLLPPHSFFPLESQLQLSLFHPAGFPLPSAHT
eukprot:768600-Hanusia_phi.AAC.7